MVKTLTLEDCLEGTLVMVGVGWRLNFREIRASWRDRLEAFWAMVANKRQDLQR